MLHEDNKIICTICLESLNKKSYNYPKYIPPIISLSCSHSYHFNCINSWFTKSCSFLCPVCKYPDKVLLENFLPEIKNALDKEILNNNKEFHTEEEYDEYCETCIKQGNMLKIIDLQQMINAHNQDVIEDDYNTSFDINRIINSDNSDYNISPNIDDIINNDTNNDNYLFSIMQNNYFQNMNCQNNITLYSPDLDFISDIEIDSESDIEEIEKNIYSNFHTKSRNSYTLNRNKEEEELEKNEMIAYARGAINCILDDEIEEEEDKDDDNDDDINDNIINHFYRNQNLVLRKRRHNNCNQHRPSLGIENIFKIVSGQSINNNDTSRYLDEEYENILLNDTTKPSFFRKYRFYIISSILFIIGYFIFL